MQLREVLSGGAGSDQGPTPEERELLRQREEYARRGIRYRENGRGLFIKGRRVLLGVRLEWNMLDVNCRRNITEIEIFPICSRSLSHFEADTRLPHLVNVDEDPFRHNRFVYVLNKRVTVFGPQGDVQPMSLR